MKINFFLAVLLFSTPLLAESNDQKEILTRLDTIQKEIQELRKQVEALSASQSKTPPPPTEPKPEDITKAIQEGAKKYAIARKAGPSRDSCLVANNIADFALKYNREEDYAKWKPIAKKDCEAVSLNID